MKTTPIVFIGTSIVMGCLKFFGKLKLRSMASAKGHWRPSCPGISGVGTHIYIYSTSVVHTSHHAGEGHFTGINQEAQIAHFKDAGKVGHPQVVRSFQCRFFRGMSGMSDVAVADLGRCKPRHVAPQNRRVGWALVFLAPSCGRVTRFHNMKPTRGLYLSPSSRTSERKRHSISVEEWTPSAWYIHGWLNHKPVASPGLTVHISHVILLSVASPIYSLESDLFCVFVSFAWYICLSSCFWFLPHLLSLPSYKFLYKPIQLYWQSIISIVVIHQFIHHKSMFNHHVW